MLSTCHGYHSKLASERLVPHSASKTYLRDPALHNEKVGIVDVQLNALEKCLNVLLRRLVTVQEIFRDVWECDLVRA